MRTCKLLVLLLLAVFTVNMFVQDGFGQSKSGSRKPSSSKSSGGSSSKPASSKSSGGSSSKPASRKPSSSSSSKPASSKPSSSSSSKPTSSKSSGLDSSKPKFGSPNTVKPPESATKPPVVEKPKFGSPNTVKSAESTTITEKPKFGSPNTVKPIVEPEKPKFGSPTTQQTGDTAASRKPTSTANTAKSDAAKQERSRRVYVESQQAKAPPKPVYTTPEGKTVKVNTDSQVTKSIRNNPSSYYRPEIRTQRTESHVTHHHYQHPTGWYYSQPSVYVGGGYNSAFWWMMMEWDAERRAQWFYNHQNTIEHDAYERGMRDSVVAQRVAELKAQNSKIDPDYVDPEFAKDPSIMYTQEHIEAVYNPEVVTNNASGSIAVLLIVGMLCVAAYVLIFRVRWGK